MLYVLNDGLFKVVEKKQKAITDGASSMFPTTEYFPSASIQESEEHPIAGLKYPILSVRHYPMDAAEECGRQLWFNAFEDEKGYNRVFVSTGKSKNDEDADMYLVGIPFRGKLAKVESKYFRIYKAQVFRSDKYSIEYEGQMYNKIAYMLFTVDEEAMKADGVTNVTLEIRSFVREMKKNKETGGKVETGNFIRYSSDITVTDNRVFSEDAMVVLTNPADFPAPQEGRAQSFTLFHAPKRQPHADKPTNSRFNKDDEQEQRKPYNKGKKPNGNRR